MKVIAIDPGERVGWAHGTIEPVVRKDGLPWVGDGTVKITQGHDLAVTGHGISFLKDFALKLVKVAGNYDVIVYEDYRISSDRKKLLAHTGSNVPTLQLIGMIRLAAWLNPQAKLVTQYPRNKPTAMKSMPPWLREKIDGLPAAHDDAHDGDALMHLWHYYWQHYV